MSKRPEWTNEDIVDAMIDGTVRTTHLLEDISKKLTILLWLTAIPWVLLLIGMVVQIVVLASERTI